MKTAKIEWNDVLVDGYPVIEYQSESVLFLHGGNVFTGWPLIRSKGEGEGDDFPTLEEANAGVEVEWEANSDAVSGLFSGVQWWAKWPKGLKIMAVTPSSRICFGDYAHNSEQCTLCYIRQACRKHAKRLARSEQ